MHNTPSTVLNLFQLYHELHYYALSSDEKSAAESEVPHLRSHRQKVAEVSVTILHHCVTQTGGTQDQQQLE